MSTFALSFEIARHNLSACYLPSHLLPSLRGTTAVGEAPTDSLHDCPSCGREADCKLHAEGGTARALPIWERVEPKMRLKRYGRLAGITDSKKRPHDFSGARYESCGQVTASVVPNRQSILC